MPRTISSNAFLSSSEITFDWTSPSLACSSEPGVASIILRSISCLLFMNFAKAFGVGHGEIGLGGQSLDGESCQQRKQGDRRTAQTHFFHFTFLPSRTLSMIPFPAFVSIIVIILENRDKSIYS